jgi:hypothetical protein
MVSVERGLCSGPANEKAIGFFGACVPNVAPVSDYNETAAPRNCAERSNLSTLRHYRRERWAKRQFVAAGFSENSFGYAWSASGVSLQRQVPTHSASALLLTGSMRVPQRHDVAVSA